MYKNFCENVVRDSETTKRAVFYSALPSHEAYQVKGDVVSVTPLSEADVSESQQYCDQVIQTLTELGFSPDIPKKIWGRVADTGITIELEQIFNQFASQQEEEDSNIIENTTVGSGNVKAKPSAAVMPTTVSVNVGDNNDNSAAVVPITDPESDKV